LFSRLWEIVRARFVADSPLERDGFKTSVPGERAYGLKGDAERLGPLLADAEIVVGHIWRASFPPAPRLRA
jgi:hypothetical protein